MTKPTHEKHWEVDVDTGEIIDTDTGKPVDFMKGDTAEHVAALPDVVREFREVLEAVGEHLTRAQRRNAGEALRKAGAT